MIAWWKRHWMLIVGAAIYIGASWLQAMLIRGDL